MGPVRTNRNTNARKEFIMADESRYEDGDWSGRCDTTNVRHDIVSEELNQVSTWSTHTFHVNNKRSKKAEFSAEYRHVIQKKNAGGGWDDVERSAWLEHATFFVEGDSSYDHAALHEDAPTDYLWYFIRNADHNCDDGGEYRLDTYTRISAVTYDGFVRKPGRTVEWDFL